ncbi:hypothetical protein GWO58_10535 [Corynebacterium macginleyi]|uniref:hypothetical protein n=1 Tax=Corynebacterium macginleyi TaxID=38290 RepID=UPI00190A776B|nr:hypothetical protein [Corynebacterium macginleyi]MBK4147198.1 hypothetical protein [Corynebacterium macginleyi]
MSAIDLTAPLYCQYFTAESTVDKLELITATLRERKQVEGTMVSMATAALYNHTLTFTGESWSVHRPGRPSAHRLLSARCAHNPRAHHLRHPGRYLRQPRGVDPNPGR